MSQHKYASEEGGSWLGSAKQYDLFVGLALTRMRNVLNHPVLATCCAQAHWAVLKETFYNQRSVVTFSYSLNS